MVRLSNVLKAATGGRVGRIEKRWSFDAKTAITTKPVVGKLDTNVIVFGTKDGKLFLLNENSELLWVYSIEEKLRDMELYFKEAGKTTSIYCTPVIADINNDGNNEILFGSETGMLYALDPKGKLLWSFRAKDAIRSSPLVADINNDGKNEIIFGSSDRNLYALDSNGNLLWQSSCEAGIEAPASVLEGENLQIIFGSNNGTIYSLNKEGHLLWRFRAKGKITAQPVIGNIYGDDEKYILIGSSDRLHVLDREGKLKWEYKTEGRIASAVCLADLNGDGRTEIIFGSCDDRVYVLSCQGSRIWSYEADFWVVASPVAVDIDNDNKAEVIIGSYDHSIYVLDGQGAFTIGYMPGVSSVTQQAGSYTDIMTSQVGNYTGKRLWQYKTEGMIIGISLLLTEKKEKNLIVATDNGRIEAFVHKKR